MITITTWNMKGGTGKTTTTFNLATNYARAGKKVLCIDLDIQANLTAFFEKDMHKRKADIKQVLEKSVSAIRGIVLILFPVAIKKLMLPMFSSLVKRWM